MDQSHTLPCAQPPNCVGPRLHRPEQRQGLGQHIDCNKRQYNSTNCNILYNEQSIHLRKAQLQLQLLRGALCTLLLRLLLQRMCSDPIESLPVDVLQLVLQCVSITPDAVCVRVLVLQLLIHALQKHTVKDSTGSGSSKSHQDGCTDFARQAAKHARPTCCRFTATAQLMDVPYTKLTSPPVAVTPVWLVPVLQT